MSANREYKSSVFATLFGDSEKLLSLYNAVSGSQLPLDTPVDIATLDDVLFTDRRNDIAFVLDDRVVILLEHQSSICANMPLRLLIYMARVYEKLIDSDAVYMRKLLKIPKPDFLVLYNGVEPFPDEVTLCLSEAFKKAPVEYTGLGGSLELEVRVVNINEGRNNAIVTKCEALHGYVRFVQKVRDNSDVGLDLTAAVIKAVQDCIGDGILTDFLKKQSSEVINLLTTEWNWERAMDVRAREAREDGVEEGREEGRVEGVSISKLIIRDLKKNVSPDTIAVQYKVSVEMVKELQSALED